MRIDKIHPNTLAALLRDPSATAHGLLALRKALPEANVSAIVSANPNVIRLAISGELRQVCHETDPGGLRLRHIGGRLQPGAEG